MTDTCPRCGGEMDAPRTAISRKDNSTRVCPACGTEEALAQMGGGDPWPTFPHPLRADRAQPGINPDEGES